jgi:hypothetical protein
MARVKQSSRRLFLGAAFICVMAGSGALFGAIAGLMLILLTHAMLRIDGGILPVMLASGALGMMAAILWSLLLVMRSAHGNLVLAGDSTPSVRQT